MLRSLNSGSGSATGGGGTSSPAVPSPSAHHHPRRRKGISDDFGSTKNAHHQQPQTQQRNKTFVFGVILGAMGVYTLMALAESIRFTHSEIHHHIHHHGVVPDFNMLGGIISSTTTKADNSGRVSSRRKWIKNLERKKQKAINHATESDKDGNGSDDDDDDEEEDVKKSGGDNNDITDDELLANLKNKQPPANEQANKRKRHRVMGNAIFRPGLLGAQQLEDVPQEANVAQNIKLQLERRRRAREKRIKKKKPKTERAFDERLQQNKAKEPPKHDDDKMPTIVAEMVPAELDAPISPDLLRKLNLVDLCDAKQNRLKIDETRKICLQGTFPQYTHVMPHFLPGTDDQEVFMKQPENTLAMEDDWINWKYQTCIILHPNAKQISGRINAGGIDSFQHFHDNAIGHIYQMRHAYDFIQKAIHPCHMKEAVIAKRAKNALLFEEWELLGFPLGYKNKVFERRPQLDLNNDISVGVSFFPQDFDQVRIHPLHVQWLRSKYTPEVPITKNKVIFISRQGSNMSNFGRQFKNENAFLEKLRAKIPDLVYFHAGKEIFETTEGLRKHLSDTCIIIGLHGGHMYNQFYASAQTSVLELMPVDDRGLFHNQKTERTRPVLGHRCIWHNSNLIGQPYWRIHFKSPRGTMFEFDDTTIDKIYQVVLKAGCSASNKATS